MIISKSDFICFSCRNIVLNPNFCDSCKNIFCENCKSNIINNQNECPFCHKSPFNIEINITFQKLIANLGILCKYCNKIIYNINEFDYHNKGEKLTCKLCKKIYLGNYCFIGHLEKENQHKKYLLSKLGYKLDKSEILTNEENINDLELIQKQFFNDDNLLLSIKENKFIKKTFKPMNANKSFEIEINKNNKGKTPNNHLDIFNCIEEEEKENKNILKNNMKTPKIDNKNSIDIKYENRISKIKELSNEEKNYIISEALEFGSSMNLNCDLFYCYKNNDLNCNCCQKKICEPGSCFCIICLDYNKKYHNLPNHYLINKNGKVSKLIFGNFYCNYEYITEKYQNNNLFEIKNTCFFPNYQCKACKELSFLAKKYLGKELYEKLMEKKKKC